MIFIAAHPVLDLSQTSRAAHAPVERRRVDLQTGQTTAITIVNNPGISPTEIVHAACNTARRTGLVASLAMPDALHRLPGPLFGVLARSGLSPRMLELTLTEPMITNCDVEDLLALSALRDVGIGLVLSDFRPTAPPLLRWLPVNGIALSEHIIADLPGSPEAAAQLRSLLDTARAHGLTTTATGVTTEEQRALLSGLGCGNGEGELFG